MNALFEHQKRLRVILIISVAVIVIPEIAQAQSLAPDEADKNERDFFNFLIGKWEIVEKKTSEGVTTGGRDTYTFRKGLDGNAIISQWYFNRGTKSDPNYTKGLYYSAYDNLTNTWSFYYISAASAQYYEGKKEGGQWYFYKDFTIEGNTFSQRQSWSLEDDSTLIRKIENSEDNGKTWNEVYVVTLGKAES